MVALNEATLTDLPQRIERPAYDRSRLSAGIAHLSVGNFHRAHQAAYIDRCLALPGHEGWGICGIGVVANAAEQAKAQGFARQDGLYTLTLFPPRSAPTSRVIGAMVDSIFAPDDPAKALDRLADPAIRIVSMTITEGGYNIDEATGKFRLDAPGIVHDLANPQMPRTVFGYITTALARRRASGTPPFTVLSCDNLRHNGDVVRRALLSFADAADPELATWIADHATFPNGMVDRITPAVTPADVRRLNELTGIDDEVPIFAEEFSQWVVEDNFCNGRPALEQAGVQLTGDVKVYEQVKLRMLNASHSMLAYPGLLGGYRLVHEAMADPRIQWLLRTFLDRDVIPLLDPPPGMALDRYRDTVLERFSNPAINDQLPRIASDGGSKIPVFLADTIKACVDRGGDLSRLAFQLAAFTQYLAGVDDKGAKLTPQEPHLTAADLALARDADPAAPLRISTLKGLGLDGSSALVESYVGYRKAIAAQGALRTLESLASDGG
jgi:mannitol-1-phosphate/altronate dehydrogenase